MFMISLIRLVCGPLDTNSYLILGKDEAWAIDPAPESAQRLLDEAEKRNVRITLIINTHGHWDHNTDNAKLKQATGAKLAAHAADLGSADLLLEDNQELTLDDSTFMVMHTPGHSPGSICLYNETDNILLSGDTLFPNGHGRTDLGGGDPGAMMHSLKRLAALPKETEFYPGHGESSTIGKERWLR